ncbi:hypothetical protein [Niastella populi]|uniref:Uncharacterized protein n=1 Tax=Niastella populi TaxID=550983 RepID=A0A1V9ENV8_9BACT|nr:hypothetical protein [Niastella populi]OQP47722.1 hypothetical protein A4R26_31930 [Niastella populi]
MIKVEKEKKALKAIHDLICHGRKLAYEGTASKILAEFMDDLEYLPALMLQESDTTDLFEEYLKGTCKQFDCDYIATLYEKV